MWTNIASAVLYKIADNIDGGVLFLIIVIIICIQIAIYCGLLIIWCHRKRNRKNQAMVLSIRHVRPESQSPITDRRLFSTASNSSLNTAPNRSLNIGPNSSLNIGPNRSLNIGPNSSLNIGPNRSLMTVPSQTYTNMNQANRSAHLALNTAQNQAPNTAPNRDLSNHVYYTIDSDDYYTCVCLNERTTSSFA